MHRGETILPTHKSGGFGGTVVNNNVYVTVQGSVAAERDLARTIYSELLATRTRNGTLGLS